MLPHSFFTMKSGDKINGNENNGIPAGASLESLERIVVGVAREGRKGGR